MATSMHQLSNTNSSKMTTIQQADRSANLECITIALLDIRRELTSVFIGALRAINDYVRTFTESDPFLHYVQSSHEKIFVVLTLNSDEFLFTMHSCASIEAIFILDSNGPPLRVDLPKVIGIYTQQEELVRTVRMTLETFEQVQLEIFSFEADKIFLWWQLWKEEIANHRSSNNQKMKLVESARNYYRSNMKRSKMIEEFEKSYRSNDSLRWCFQSSFPSRLLKCALMSPTLERVTLYQFLVTDVARVLQQQTKRSNHGQLYRGMKLAKDVVDIFDANTGKLVCSSGYFMCSKSRNIELQFATSAGYRSDLISVLFKIDFDGSARFTDILLENESTVTLFDVATNFRVICVNRGTMTIIKMKVATDEGKKIAQDYKGLHKGKSVQVLLDELTTPPKSSTPPPEPPKIEVKKKQTSTTDIEAQARAHLDRGDIDQALVTYQTIDPMTVRILKIIAQLAADEKHDYQAAIGFYQQALKLQKESGEHSGEILILLASVCLQANDYDSALRHYNRALTLYESSKSRDTNAIAVCLTGIANAHRGRKDLVQALDYAQRAWTLSESSRSANDQVVAKSLHLLTNIHHDLGDEAQALKLGTRAMALMERIHPTNPWQSAQLLNTLGLIQMKLGDLSESRNYFERSIKIYHHSFPTEVSKRTEVEKNLQTVLKMQEKIEHLQYYS